MSKLKLLTTIKADGTITSEVADNNLERLQKTVGGYIQIVPHFTKYNDRRCICYANENGRPDIIYPGLPLNQTASDLWRAQLGDGPFLYEPDLFGDIIIEQTYVKREEISK